MQRTARASILVTALVVLIGGVVLLQRSSLTRTTADLYAADEDGTHLHRLTSTSTAETSPAWSPEGGSIVFEWSHWEPSGR